MKPIPIVLLIAGLLLDHSPARAETPRSKIIAAGTGDRRPQPGDHVVVYRAELGADGQPKDPWHAYRPVVRKVRAGAPEGDVLMQMVVGEKRRFWRPAGGPGRPAAVFDLELVAITGASVPAKLPNPPPHQARHTADGISYVVLDPGKGDVHPGSFHRVYFTARAVDPDDHPLPRSIRDGTAFVADIEVPVVAEVLRSMVAGEKRYVWIPPEKNAAAPMWLMLSLNAIYGKIEQVAPPADLAAPPKNALRTRSSKLPYVIVRRGRAHPPLKPKDQVTYRYTAWRADGVTVASHVVENRTLQDLSELLRELSSQMATAERRRVWVSSLPPKPAAIEPPDMRPAVVEVELLAIKRRMHTLPDRMRIVWSDASRKLSVVRGRERAPLFPGGFTAVGETWTAIGLEAVEPSQDGDAVDLTLIQACSWVPQKVSYRVAELRARLKNVAALRLHRAKQYAAAEKGFRAAVALAPDFDLAYTNLASALVRQGKTRAAVDALQPLIARNPAWAYWKVHDDAELAPLRREPRFSAQFQPAREAVRVDRTDGLGSPGLPVAWSERHRLIATLGRNASGGSTHFSTELRILGTDGRLRLRMPLVRWNESNGDCDDGCGDGVLPEARAAVAARNKRATELLAALGFTTRPAAVNSFIDEYASPPRASLPAAKLALVRGKDRVRVVRRNEVLAEAPLHGKKFSWAALFPGMLVYGWYSSQSEDCDTYPTSEEAIIGSPRLR